MPGTLTFLQTAKLIAYADGIPETAIPSLLRRIRSFDSNGIVSVEREETGRREGRLDLVAACATVIASELSDFGLTAPDLREMRAVFARPADLGSSDNNLAAAIRQIKAGHPVFLEITTWRRFGPERSLHFQLRGHVAPSDRAEDAAVAYNASRGEARAWLNLDLGAILGGFIPLFEAATAEG